MQLDRRHFLASLGGAAAISGMTSEAKAEALDSYMMQQLNNAAPAPKFPKAADIEAQIETRSYRRGVGNLFLTTQTGGNVKKLVPMPAKPTLPDFFQDAFSHFQHVFRAPTVHEESSVRGSHSGVSPA